jgi:lantibiotic biosynthesis protein
VAAWRVREPLSWRPCLALQDRRRALTAVGAIAGDLRKLLLPAQASASVWELASSALCLTYMARTTGDTGDALAAQTLLNAAIDLAGGGERLPMCLHRGAAGLAWILHHAARALGVEGAADATQALDEELLGYLQGPGNIAEPYDLLDGLLGLGVYGFESASRPLVERAVQRLAARQQIAAEGLAWHSPPQSGNRSGFPEGHCNLGLAHGVAGVIAFLASAAQEGIETDTARPLLLDTVHWLRRQRLPDGGPRAFPWAVAAGRPPVAQGLDPGWAYADAGIAAALAHAARALGDADLLEEALSVATQEAARMDELPARHPGIGFGPAGYAQIFARLYQQTGRPVFRRAARREILRLLEMRAPGTGVGGFSPEDAAGRPGSVDLGFLGGASGIGLVLLGAATGVDPQWDRILLLSPLRLEPLP